MAERRRETAVPFSSPPYPVRQDGRGRFVLPSALSRACVTPSQVWGARAGGVPRGAGCTEAARELGDGMWARAPDESNSSSRARPVNRDTRCRVGTLASPCVGRNGSRATPHLLPEVQTGVTHLSW